MCVIIIKKKGQALPSRDMLKAAYSTNPHGCGFATPTKSFKGMDFDEFYNRIKAVTVDEPCIIHFRIATAGSVCIRNCHPFKSNDIWFAHNGCLDVEPFGDWTDSETAFRGLLLPVIRSCGFESEEFKKTCDRIRGNGKFAFLDGNRLRLYGSFVDVMGYACSNDYFEWRIGQHLTKREHWVLTY